MTQYKFLLSVILINALVAKGQPPSGAVAARPNIIYYAGGACTFYDTNYNLLLSVDAAEAIWSSTPAKAAWVVVTPTNGGYYEFPNYTSESPTCIIPQYLQPFWKTDTIYNELVLLNGIQSSAKLMFPPQRILSVSNYDFSQTFVQNTDFSVNGNVITQLTSKVSASYLQTQGKKGNGQPNGLLNTQPTSWTCVSYVPDKSNWRGSSLLGYKGGLLPKTMSKLKNRHALTIQAYGMSITAGLNVSGFAGDGRNFTPTKPYMHSYIDLLKDALEIRFGSDITMINGSCGGKTVAWIDRYCQSMVVPNVPDLVILDMGMNDIWGTTSNVEFKNSMQSCIEKIKSANPNTEFILVGNMLPDVHAPGAPPNGADLIYGFLSQLKSLEAPGIAVFDMTTLSDTIYHRKGARNCLSNALHPNDYLARWYAQGLAELFNDGSIATPKSVKYYVNTTGNNTDGLTPATAWTSLDKINVKIFNPGDTILFEGGKTFTGHLEFDQNDGNSPESPIILSTYGTGTATINTTSTSKCGFKAVNTQGFHLSQLHFKGPGNGTQKDIDGILFFTTNPSGYLSNISIKNCEVSRFGHCGIRFYSNWDANVKAGYKDVVIDQCKVHDCRENGIVTIGYDHQNTNFYHHKNFMVKNTEVYDITGYPSSFHKGSGIVLSQIDSCLIDRCVAHNNGLANTACGGPGGIWVWSASRVTIQFCESYQNSSGNAGGCDGIGFDLDAGVTHSTIQYCYSHDNDGAGFLLGNPDGARPWGNNTVRFCLSVNDARTNHSAVTLFTSPNTQWSGLKFYNNSIYTTPSSKNKYATFGAFQITDYGMEMTGLECYNNIFHTSGSLPLLTIPGAFISQNPKFLGNLYWNANDSFLYKFGSSYTTLAAFRNACNFCEKISGQNTGYESDPQWSSIPYPAPVLYPSSNDSLDIGKIGKLSDAKDNGIDLNVMFGIHPGIRDFYGTSLPFNGKFDIGAHEWNEIATLSYSPDYAKLRVYPNPISYGNLKIIVSNTRYSNSRLRLYDILGNLKDDIVLQEGTNTMETEHLEKGAYLLILTTAFHKESIKIIIAE